MRFMEWSKSNFPVRFAALALVGAFVASLGVVGFPSEAEAGKGKRWVYAVKFKCTEIGTPVISVGSGVFLAVQTVVNIYNPTEESILFRKHYVIAANQDEGIDSEKTDKEPESVGPGLGHAINCFDIVDRLVSNAGITPSSYIGDEFSQTIEGWVIIEAPKEKEASKKPILSVCANYQHALFVTGSSEAGSGISLDVECYEPKKVKPRF